MEQYLIEDFGFQTFDYLNSQDEIIAYFKDNGSELFDCGQGYYEDKIKVFTKLQEQCYAITITASIESQRQDRGDRLYFVEEIESVTFEKIVHPKPLIPFDFNLSIYETNEKQKEKLIKFLIENKFKFK